MTQTFINKYKPIQIEDFHYNPEFIAVFNALHKIDDLNILLVGSISSGKTTLLYSIIRRYFSLKNDDYISENNILFINNLKEQGVNYFRNEMKLFCQSKSSIFGKKKLIIIDDLDMISEQNQQVFRNYIDKYKNNINFISVCTNIQKVIESIQSRIHVLKIPKYDNDYLRTHIMEKILLKENIKLSEECREYVFKSAGNSIRQLINNLEKIFIYWDNSSNIEDVSTKSYQFYQNMNSQSDIKLILDNKNISDDCEITLIECQRLCSNISFQLFETYILELKQNKLQTAISIMYGIHDYGYSVIDILDLFFLFIKSTEILDDEIKYCIIPIICKYITVFHIVHEDIIELALFTNEIFLFFVSKNFYMSSK